jgi:phosphotransacetylase
VLEGRHRAAHPHWSAARGGCEARRHGLKIRPGQRLLSFVNPEEDPRYDYVELLIERRPPRRHARKRPAIMVRTNPTGSPRAPRRGDADAMICGLEGQFEAFAKRAIDHRPRDGVRDLSTLSMLINLARYRVLHRYLYISRPERG